MRKSLKRYIAATLSLLLAISLLPPGFGVGSVSAAPNLEIQNWVVSANQPQTPSQVTTETVDVEVDYSEIASDSLANLYYEITEISTGITKEVRDNTPDQINQQRIVFRDVELSEGLNKITVIYDSVSSPSSLPAWINFTAVATISDLSIEDEVFTHDIFVPENNPLPGQTNIFINGTAPNATEVNGYTTLNPGGVRAGFFLPDTGDLSFSAGDDNADLQLRPGDNELTIVAANPFKTYRAERNFIYNNGDSFLFNTRVLPSDDAALSASQESKLFQQPTFSATDKNGPFKLDMETDVKINRSNLGDLTHNELQLEINGNNRQYNVTFSNLSEINRTVDYSISAPGVQRVTNVAGISNNQSVDLSWDASEAVDFGQYEIYYMVADPAEDLTFNAASASSVTINGRENTETRITGLENGVTYEFVVYAVDSEGNYSGMIPAEDIISLVPGVYANAQAFTYDGDLTNDWQNIQADTRFTTSDADGDNHVYVTWDENTVYYTMAGDELDTARTFYLYINGDNGTLSGLNGAQALPFAAKYLFEIPLNDLSAIVGHEYDSGWGNDAGLPAAITNIDYDDATKVLQMSISREAIGFFNEIPTQDSLLYMLSFLEDVNGDTYAMAPNRSGNTFVDGTPNATDVNDFFAFDLNKSQTPVAQMEMAVTAAAVENRHQGARITWEQSDANDFASYVLAYDGGATIATINDQEQTSYVLNGLTNGDTYDVNVYVVNENGQSGEPTLLSVEPNAPYVIVDPANDLFTAPHGDGAKFGSSYVSWDDDFVYIGIKDSEIESTVDNANNKSLVVYFGGDTGTGTGLSFDGQRAHLLPFDSQYSIEANLGTSLDSPIGRQYNTASGWIVDTALVDDGEGFDISRTGDELTLKVSRDALNLPIYTEKPLELLMFLVDETEDEETTYLSAPAGAFADGLNPAISQYFSFDLKSVESPAVGQLDTGIVTVKPNSGDQLRIEISDDYYILQDLLIPNIMLDTENPNQLLEVSFEPRPGFEVNTQDFLFHYVNELDPFVDHVRFRESGTRLYSGIEVTISLETIELLVQTENDADGVDVSMPGMTGGVIATGDRLITSAANFQVKDNDADPAVYEPEPYMSHNAVTLEWDASPDATKYELYYAKGSSANKGEDGVLKHGEVLNTSTHERQFSGLDSNTEYTFTVYAVDNEGNFSPARSVTVETATDTVSEATIGASSPATAADYFLVTMDQSQLPEGRNLLEFMPFTNETTGKLEHTVGAKEFLINYNPSPYVYVSNIYSGQIYGDISNNPKGRTTAGIDFNGPVLQIVPVNLPSNQWGDIRIRLNDKIDKIRIDSDEFPSSYEDDFDQESDLYPYSDDYEDGDYSDFEEFRFYFGEQLGNDAQVNRRDWGLNNGLNELMIEIYPRGTLDDEAEPATGVEPITTFKYELFYFTDDLPEVTSLELEADFMKSYDFIKLEGEDYRYYTQEQRLQFEADIINAKDVHVIFNHFDEDDQPQRSEARLEWDDGEFEEVSDPDNILGTMSTSSSSSDNDPNGSGTLTSRVVDLLGTGTNTVEIIAINDAGLMNTKIIEIIREPASFVVHYPTIDMDTKVGTINGNYTRLYVEAEKADRIVYDDEQIINRTTTVNINGEPRELFVFEVKDLRSGSNTVEFSIFRGTQEEEAEITLINADTAVPGAEFKESIDSRRIRAFDRTFELSFPSGTVLIRNDETAAEQALSPTRDILVGIADPIDGRVNKKLHPAFNESSRFSSKNEWDTRYLLLREPTGRFRQISDLFWIDGGTVGDSQGENLYGSGVYPYERNQEFYTRNAGNLDEQFVPSQPGELTLQYDPNMVNSAWRYITVYHYGYNEDHLGNKRYEWKNVGGVVNPKDNTITVPIEEFGYYTVMYMDQSYDDIIGHPWARPYLEAMYSKGLMKAKESSRFETNEPITRGEFTTLIAKAFELPLNYEGRPTFSDVRVVDPLSQGLYEYKYIETAARAGIVRGNLGGRFLPNNNITREQAASIIAIAANLSRDSDLEKVSEDLEKEFTDAADIADYFKASVLAVFDDGFITGKPNISGSQSAEPTFYFDPQANLTRAEAALVIMRVLLEQKKIPEL